MKIVDAPVSGWRWPLVWAGVATVPVGLLIVQMRDLGQLVVGIPALLIVFGAVVWRWGFGADDRELFKMKKPKPSDIELPPPGTSGGAPM